MTARDFRAAARAKLYGKYWQALGVSAVAWLMLSFGTSLSSAVSVSNVTNLLVTGGGVSLLFNALFGGIVSLLVLASFVVTGAVTVGRANYFLKLADGERAKFETLFGHFRHLGGTILLTLIISGLTLLWVLPGFVLLFVVAVGVGVTFGVASLADVNSLPDFFSSTPAMIAAVIIGMLAVTAIITVLAVCASLRYSMAPYIFAEHPELGAWQAVKLSVSMTRGNRLRLLRLQLSFIGWYLLAFLVMFGLGMVFLSPYTFAAEAEFFNEISGKNYARMMYNNQYAFGPGYGDAPAAEGCAGEPGEYRFDEGRE